MKERDVKEYFFDTFLKTNLLKELVAERSRGDAFCYLSFSLEAMVN